MDLVLVIVIVIVVGAALLALRLVRKQQVMQLQARLQGQEAEALKDSASKLVTQIGDQLSVRGCATHYLLTLKRGKQ